MSSNQTASVTRRLTESALMIALGTILSMIPLAQMPFGGSVTAFSMVPVVLIAYRHGTPWGLLTGLTYALIQMLLGLKNLSYATSWVAGVAIVMLDYLLAFTALGLSGVFRKKLSQTGAMSLGALLACLIRYLCHVVSGCTVWAGVSIPTSDGLIYSLIYNAAYMVPETIVTVAGAFYLAQVLDFSSVQLTRAKRAQRSAAQTGWLAGGLLAATAALVVITLHVFSHMQGEDGFDITLLAGANWLLVGLTAAVGAAVCGVCVAFSRRFAPRTAA